VTTRSPAAWPWPRTHRRACPRSARHHASEGAHGLDDRRLPPGTRCPVLRPTTTGTPTSPPAREHAQRRVALAHAGRHAAPARRLRAVVRRAAGALRHPITVVNGAKRVAVRFGYAAESDKGPTAVDVDLIEAAAPPAATATRSSSTRRPARCSRPGTPPLPHRLVRRLGAIWSLSPTRCDPRLDVGRCRRPADPARAAALRRGEGRPRPTTRSASPPT